MAASGDSTATTSKPSGTTDTKRFCSFPGVELARVGKWHASTGPVEITRADLAAAAAASHRLPHPVLKLGHDDPRFGGSPALGHLENLRVTDRGNTLVGDLVDVPQWLATDMAKHYPQRSIEACANYETNGRIYRFAITGLALLGASWPAVTDLPSLQELLAKES